MGNCLKTQLKSNVNNENLDYLGMATLYYSRSANPTTTNRMLTIAIKSNLSGTLKIVGGNFVQEDLTTVIGNTFSYESYPNIRYYTLYISNDDCTIYIPKYDLAAFQATGDWNLVEDTKPRIKDWTLFKFSEGIVGSVLINCNEVLDLSILANHNPGNFVTRTPAIGDLPMIAHFTNVYDLKLLGDNNSFSGNISVLGNLKNLQACYIGSPNIYGTLESFADAMVSGENPRTSGSLYLYVGPSECTYEGSKFNNATITFDSSLPTGYSISVNR